MEVMVVLVFISLVLVAGAVVLFCSRVIGGDVDHGERLALLPVEETEGSVLARGSRKKEEVAT